ncbi:MAG TPA: phosphopantetheine-binding protein [Nitrospiraceae bacterium]|jgi:acyl carrier protein|nr:phosphopantetheine-binding protein [Nitrospiraceae bacterium]
MLNLLGEVAPEADLTTLKPDRSFRDQLDIDSMDFLDFVALHKEFHLEVPESDYPQLVSVDGCVGYLERKLSQ